MLSQHYVADQVFSTAIFPTRPVWHRSRIFLSDAKVYYYLPKLAVQLYRVRLQIRIRLCLVDLDFSFPLLCPYSALPILPDFQLLDQDRADTAIFHE